MQSDQDCNPDAELVASKLLGFLIKAFIEKVWQDTSLPLNRLYNCAVIEYIQTGHEPNAEEVEQLLEEMTPERVAALLGDEVCSAELCFLQLYISIHFFNPLYTQVGDSAAAPCASGGEDQSDEGVDDDECEDPEAVDGAEEKK